MNIKFELRCQYVFPILSFNINCQTTHIKTTHSNTTRLDIGGIIGENVFHAGYDLPLLRCGIHYKPRYGKWKEVIFPARDLKVC